MIAAFLGALDIFTAFVLHNPGIFEFVTFYLGVFYFIKGLMSFIGSFASGYFFEWMGTTDLLAGLCLIFAFEIPFLWILLVIKGFWSVITGW